MTSQRLLYRSVLRREFHPFLERVYSELHNGESMDEAWHIEVMCVELEKVARGETRRLLINVPPRHLKSITASVAFPAWKMGRDPRLKFLVASYNQDLADLHARHFRQVVRSTWYHELFPELSMLRDVRDELTTTRGGARYAASLTGTITGRGADILIVDDLLKAVDASSATERANVQQAFDQTLMTRLNSQTDGRVVVVEHRLHEDDLSAHLLGKGTFEHLCFPMVAEEESERELTHGRRHVRCQGEILVPERDTEATIERLRREIGPTAFSAQYQQRPVPPEGARIHMDRLRFHDLLLDPSHYLITMQSWDTAVTASPSSSFSVCTTWGLLGRTWYLIDIWRGRLEFSDLLGMAEHLRREWRAQHVYIEDANVGPALRSELRLRTGDRHIWTVPAREPKEVRFATQVRKLEEGEALLPQSAPWREALLQELRAFPDGQYDDQVDSIAQFLSVMPVEDIRVENPDTGGEEYINPSTHQQAMDRLYDRMLGRPRRRSRGDGVVCDGTRLLI